MTDVESGEANFYLCIIFMAAYPIFGHPDTNNKPIRGNMHMHNGTIRVCGVNLIRPLNPSVTDGTNGGCGWHTVLSKITTKWSFTVLWHLLEPPSPRLYLRAVSCRKRCFMMGGCHNEVKCCRWFYLLVLWNYFTCLRPNVHAKGQIRKAEHLP